MQRMDIFDWDQVRQERHVYVSSMYGDEWLRLSANLCRNKGTMDKEKVRAIMTRVATLAALYGSQIWGVTGQWPRRLSRAHDRDI